MELKRVQKRTARRLYNEGVTIWLFPCKANINSPWWGGGYPLSKKYLEDNIEDTDFDKQINGFEYYNCNSEVGYYAAFYVEE